MGIFSSATEMTTPVKNAFSYGWFTFVAVGTTARGFLPCREPPSEPATDIGGVPGNDKDGYEPIKNIDGDVNETDTDTSCETDTDTSCVPVNDNDMDIEDSATQKICVCYPLTVESIKDDVHVETNIVLKLRNFCRSYCSHGLSAAAKVDSSAMEHVMGMLKNCLPDEQARADLGWDVFEIAMNISSNAIRKELSCIPGGLVLYHEISKLLYRLRGSRQNNYQSSSKAKQNNYQSLSKAKEIEDLKRDLKELRARVDELEKQCSACTCGCKKLHDQPEVLEPDLGWTSKNTVQEDSISETLTLKSHDV